MEYWSFKQMGQLLGMAFLTKVMNKEMLYLVKKIPDVSP